MIPMIVTLLQHPVKEDLTRLYLVYRNNSSFSNPMSSSNTSFLAPQCPYPYPTSVNVAYYPSPPQYSSSLSSPQQNVPSQQPQHYDDQQQQPMEPFILISGHGHHS
ncbi:hypothetical protein Btru_024202 [Bulinus truncatus]|nr:hypothetical protein Btru_024202 [Bulinus truncatus]